MPRFNTDHKDLQTNLSDPDKQKLIAALDLLRGGMIEDTLSDRLMELGFDENTARDHALQAQEVYSEFMTAIRQIRPAT